MDNNPENKSTGSSFGSGGFASDSEPVPPSPVSPQMGPTPPTSNPATGMPLPPKKSKKPLIIALVVVLLLACAGGAAYYFLVMNKSSTTADSSTQPKASPSPAALTAKTLIEQVKSKLKGSPLVATKTTSTGGTTDDNTWVYGLASNTVTGKKYKNFPVTGYGIAATGDATTAVTDFAAVTGLFTSMSMTVSNVTQGQPGESTIASAVYSSDDIICSVSQNKYSVSEVNVGCADISSYEAAAAKIDPFYTAYMASKPQSIDNLVFGLPNIKNGSDGYKNADVYQGGFAGLYYQAPGKDWVFFLGTQNELSCSKFNTVDLKKAFNGERCYDEIAQKDSTVSV